jgi:endonuclease IV
MTKDEALKQAFEALEELVEFVPLLQPTCAGDERAIGHKLDRAKVIITAIKEALAQPAL